MVSVPVGTTSISVASVSAAVVHASEISTPAAAAAPPRLLVVRACARPAWLLLWWPLCAWCAEPLRACPAWPPALPPRSEWKRTRSPNWPPLVRSSSSSVARRLAPRFSAWACCASAALCRRAWRRSHWATAPCRPAQVASGSCSSAGCWAEASARAAERWRRSSSGARRSPAWSSFRGFLLPVTLSELLEYSDTASTTSSSSTSFSWSPM
mmetsp:Transcript_30043/g.79819  ORF Transcript_30043/g.79819 Transcript_30043/m.79819 type:complete len:211 (-) Transcript_30043:2238-2870(-)